MLFSYKFFKVSRLFSQHPNKFHYRKFQNHNHNHKFFIVSRLFSQRHYHTTIATTKIKITERDRWVKDRWVEGEIARRWDRAEVRSSGAVRLAQCWIGVRFVAGSAFASLSSFFLSLSLSLLVRWALSFFCFLSLLHVEGNGLKVKWICKTISRSNEQNFSQTEIIFQKFYYP